MSHDQTAVTQEVWLPLLSLVTHLIVCRRSETSSRPLPLLSWRDTYCFQEPTRTYEDDEIVCRFLRNASVVLYAHFLLRMYLSVTTGLLK